jgi:hypothetical protein
MTSHGELSIGGARKELDPSDRYTVIVAAERIAVYAFAWANSGNPFAASYKQDHR